MGMAPTSAAAPDRGVITAGQVEPGAAAGGWGSQAMRTSERRSYAEIDHWRKYQPFLPERVRLSTGREPAEEWWPWRGADIHLDRYPAPAAPLTVVLLHGGGGYSRLVAP